MISTTVKPMRKSRFALMLLLLIAPNLGVSQSLSPLWTLADEMGKGFMSSDLPTEIFKWINSEPSPAEKAKKAKPKVVALYTDLLNLQSTRNNLIQDLDRRLKDFGKPSDCGLVCDQMRADANNLGELLVKFAKDYSALAISLDQHDPKIEQTAMAYFEPNNQAAYQVGKVSTLSKAQLKTIRDKLVANTANYNNLLNSYRGFVKEHYPNELDLS